MLVLGLGAVAFVARPFWHLWIARTLVRGTRGRVL